MTPTELDQIVARLAESARQTGEVDPADIERVIADRLYEQAKPEDIARVSARLAEGGWPLANAADICKQHTPAEPEDKEGLLARVLAWLQAGYPGGVPPHDYIPIVALLRRRLTDDEVDEVVNVLVAQDAIPADSADIGAAIVKVTDSMPTETDLERVRVHLDENDLDVS